MANNNNSDLEMWVADRLGTLLGNTDFRPNTAKALAQFRSRRDAASRGEQFWGWAAAIAAVACLFFVSFPTARAAAQRYLNSGFMGAMLQAAPSLPDRPEYAGSQLVRPVDYREWIYLSSGLGMEYNAAVGGSENFTNVFVPQWAYKAFMATGKWPDKSMFALESRTSQTKGSINKTGHFQSDLAGLVVEVKDESRFPDRWAYFNFRGDTKMADAMTGSSNACWQCHDANAAVEHTFVQFYPTLKPVAVEFGTYRAQAE